VAHPKPTQYHINVKKKKKEKREEEHKPIKKHQTTRPGTSRIHLTHSAFFATNWLTNNPGHVIG
jgi:hypothetical protein